MTAVKKKTSALTLLLLALVTAQSVSRVNANFWAQATTPPPQGTIPPTITVIYSENQWVTRLLVNITSASSPTKYSFFSLPEVYYKGDWMTNESFAGYGDTFRLPLNNAPHGTHTVTIRAEQGCFYGNEDGVPYYFRTDISLIVTFTVERTQPFSAKVLSTSILDTTPPNVSVLSIENKTFVNSTVPLDFTVNDLVAQISYSLDGHGNVTIAGNTTLTGLSNGEHYVTVYYTNIAGNVGASETVHFNVEVPFPTTLVATAAGASFVIACLGLLVYFKKRNR